MQTLLSITAIVAAVAYPLIYALLRRERSALPPTLCAALLMAAALELCELLAVVQPGNFSLWMRLSLGVEAALPPTWLWFSLTYARQNEPQSIPPFQRLLLACSPLFLASVLVLPASAFFYSPDFASERILFLGNKGYFFYLFLFAYLVIALINLELTLANTSHSARWKIKFELIGAGALLAGMALYFSQGLLFRSINLLLAPARTMVLLMAVALMAYSRLKRGNGVKVYVSRQMAYKSVSLLAVGVYLTGLGMMGEGMQYFGDGFQRAMAIAVAFAAGLGLVITMLSETVRRRVRVFIHRNFYQNKYDYRNQWLQFTDRLSSGRSGDDLLQSIVKGFCDTFGMGCGALFLLDPEQDGLRPAAAVGIESLSVEFRRKDAAIQRLSTGTWVVNVHAETSGIGTEAQQAFFATIEAAFLIPLFVKEDLVGFLVTGRPLSREETYGYEDFDLMKTLARQASSALLNLRLSEQLAQAREMAAIGRVSSFVMHDLKNLGSALSLMLDNAREYIAVPEFQEELLASLGTTVAKMNTLVARLKHLPETTTLRRAPVDLLQLAHETAALLGKGELLITGTTVIAEVDREELQKVALNLMLNAVEATAGNRPVTVEVGATEAPYFRVKDEGCGIPEEFLRRHIFTPFKTTKKKGLGIGLYQCKQIVEAHGGKIEVTSEVERGSVFTVWLPKATPQTL